MKFTCPDCGKIFMIPAQDVAMLAEALRRNPPLKIICAACGLKIERAYMEIEKLAKETS